MVSSLLHYLDVGASENGDLDHSSGRGQQEYEMNAIEHRITAAQIVKLEMHGQEWNKLNDQPHYSEGWDSRKVH